MMVPLCLGMLCAPLLTALAGCFMLAGAKFTWECSGLKRGMMEGRIRLVA